MGTSFEESDVALYLHLLKYEVNGLRDCLREMQTKVEYQAITFTSFKEDLSTSTTAALHVEKVNSLNEYFGAVNSEIQLAHNKISLIENKTRKLFEAFKEIKTLERKETSEIAVNTDYNDNLENSCHKLFTSDFEVENETNYHITSSAVDQDNIKLPLLEERNVFSAGCKEENSVNENKADYSSSIEHGFTCDMCEKMFKSVNILKKHVAKVHNFNKNFNCSNCSISFNTLKELKEHEQNSHAFKSELGKSKKFTGVAKRKAKDTKKKKLIKNYICSQSEKHLSSQLQLKAQKKTHNTALFDCSKCGKQFKTQIQYKKHYTQHSEDTDIKCKYCDRMFLNLKHVNIHMKNIHQDVLTLDEKVDLLNFKTCLICQKSFVSLAELRLHKKEHKEVKSFMCDLCGISYYTNSALKRHMFTHSGTLPYPCSICTKSFLTETYLKRHMFRHTGQKPFQCVTCGDTFADDSNMRMHMRRHTGIKPFACDECPLRFYIRSQLKKHMRTHSNERPYKCKYCPAAFKNSSNCISHTRIHTGEKPYECSVCNKRFREINILKEHEGVHTGLRFPCLSCGKTYARKWGLSVHLKTNKDTCGRAKLLMKKTLPNENNHNKTLAVANSLKLPHENNHNKPLAVADSLNLPHENNHVKMLAVADSLNSQVFVEHNFIV